MTEAVLSDVAPEPPPPLLVELYLYPHRFVVERLPKLKWGAWATIATLLLVGLAGNEDTPLGKMQAAQDTWLAYWGFSLGKACVAGPASLIGVLFWFRIRVWLCGVRTVGPSALRIAFASRVATVLPLLASALAKTLTYASPAAAQGDWRSVWL